MRSALWFAFSIVLAVLSGCVSAKTTIPSKDTKCENDGIVYHLPMRKFTLSVTLDKDAKITAVSAQASEPIPDINRNLEFCGSFHRNLFAENTADFQVGTSGLLTTADADSKPKIAEALKKVATAAGYGTAVFGFSGDQKGEGDKAACKPGLTHSRLVDPIETDMTKLNLCGIQFLIEKPPVPKPTQNAKTETGVYWGVFYRQDEPYIVKVDQGSTAQYSAILLAPNSSPIRYLPLDWNLFADSTATLRFTGGMPTQYKEKIGSEALGLLSLPADLMEAYFSAIGTIFEKIGAAASGKAKAETSVAQQEAALAEQERKRLAAEEKLRLCQQAIASHDNTKIAAACQ